MAAHFGRLSQTARHSHQAFFARHVHKQSPLRDGCDQVANAESSPATGPADSLHFVVLQGELLLQAFRISGLRCARLGCIDG